MVHVSLTGLLNGTNAALLVFFFKRLCCEEPCWLSPELFVSVYYPVCVLSSLSVLVTEFVCVSVLCVVFSYEGL